MCYEYFVDADAVHVAAAVRAAVSGEGDGGGTGEAMAMGRAIITTDAPGCRETVIHGQNGYLVPVKSVEELVQAMQTFINDPQLMLRMGQRSREIALEKYDVHQVNAHMMSEMGV